MKSPCQLKSEGTGVSPAGRVWSSIVVAAGVFLLHACGGGGSGSETGSGSPTPPTSPGPSVLELTFDLTRNPALPGGTVFEASSGDVRCSAGFVSAVQSRVYANQNELEFWCREGAATALQFRSIGKPSAGQFSSSIANLNGNIYELVGRSVYQNGAWRPLRSGELPIPNDALPVALVRRESETFVFTVNGSACTGVSLYSTRGYHGTYREADWQEWSAAWTDGSHVVLNIGNEVKVATLAAPTAAPCVSMPALVDSSPRPTWLYAMMNFTGGLLYGASLDSLAACTELSELNIITRQTRLIALSPCAPGHVTEVYSLTPWRNEILVGTFPVGTLYAYSVAGNSTRLTTFGQPLSDDLPDPTWGGPYRESQSVAVSGGRVFMGMYPWAELFVQDGEGQAPTVYRLITQPAKGGEFAPYATRIAASSNVPTGQYADRTWAQRIPTIAILSGRVCASTASRTGESLQPWLTVISAAEAAPYGQVFCADVANHVMGRVEAQTRVSFRITSQNIAILQNGVVVAEVLHSLSAAALTRLATVTPIMGSGDYGPFAGTLSVVQ